MCHRVAVEVDSGEGLTGSERVHRKCPIDFSSTRHLNPQGRRDWAPREAGCGPGEGVTMACGRWGPSGTSVSTPAQGPHRHETLGEGVPGGKDRVNMAQM